MDKDVVNLIFALPIPEAAAACTTLLYCEMRNMG